MTTLPKAAIDAAASALAEECNDYAHGWHIDTATAVLRAALPHLGEPVAYTTLAGLHFLEKDECLTVAVPSAKWVAVENAVPLYLAPPAPAVAIKPLIWSPRNEQPQYEVCADCPFGRYAISSKGENGFGWRQPRQTVWSGFLPSIDEAKAAAQADYEARIRSALVV